MSDPADSSPRGIPKEQGRCPLAGIICSANAAQTVAAGTIINAHLDDSCRRGGGRALDAPAAHATGWVPKEERILSGKNKIHLERFFIICASKIGRGI